MYSRVAGTGGGGQSSEGMAEVVGAEVVGAEVEGAEVVGAEVEAAVGGEVVFVVVSWPVEETPTTTSAKTQ